MEVTWILRSIKQINLALIVTCFIALILHANILPSMFDDNYIYIIKLQEDNKTILKINKNHKTEIHVAKYFLVG